MIQSRALARTVHALVAVACLATAAASADVWSTFVAFDDARQADATTRRGDDVIDDFSYAGYRQGESSLPDATTRPSVSVIDFGAIADDEADDTDAFARAIHAGAGKVVRVPSGRYVLSDRLTINRVGTILHGDGRGKTTLAFTRGLNEVDPYPVRNGGALLTSGWSWDGGLISFDGRSGNAPNALAVRGTVPRGATTLPMELVKNVEPGQTIELRVDNPADNSLAMDLYAGDPGDVSEAGPNIFARQLAQIVAVNVAAGTIEIDRPTRFELRAAWLARVVSAEARLVDCGIDGVTIEMPSLPYLGHFRERGFNAIAFQQTRDCWARDVEIVNGDVGVVINADRTSVVGLTMRSTRERSRDGNFDGHHAIYVRGTDNLVRGADLRIRFIHDITVERGASGNVITESRGDDLCLDHHRWAPFANLWCDLDLGEGRRPWASGGAPGRGNHGGTRSVFWNLRAAGNLTLPPPIYAAPGCAFVGVGALRAATQPALAQRWTVEPLAKGSPLNLYLAQLARRLHKTAPSPTTAGHR